MKPKVYVRLADASAKVYGEEDVERLLAEASSKRGGISKLAKDIGVSISSLWRFNEKTKKSGLRPKVSFDDYE